MAPPTPPYGPVSMPTRTPRTGAVLWRTPLPVHRDGGVRCPPLPIAVRPTPFFSASSTPVPRPCAWRRRGGQGTAANAGNGGWRAGGGGCKTVAAAGPGVRSSTFVDGGRRATDHLLTTPLLTTCHVLRALMANQRYGGGTVSTGTAVRTEEWAAAESVWGVGGFSTPGGGGVGKRAQLTGPLISD